MISVIIPTFNEQDNLEPLYKRLQDLAAMVSLEFEFIFVDDCSSDNTTDILKQMHEKDNRVKIIRFARNCGSHAAIVAGLNTCKGDCAAVIAADLQDPPEIIVDLIHRLDNREICNKIRIPRVSCSRVPVNFK